MHMFVIWRAMVAWALGVKHGFCDLIFFWPVHYKHFYRHSPAHNIFSSFALRLYALDPIHRVQTLEWRHQVVPTVLRPNVRRPSGPLIVNTPTYPFPPSPPPPVVPGSQFQFQTAIAPPLIGHIPVPPSDTSKGTNGCPEVSKLHDYMMWMCMLKDKLPLGVCVSFYSYCYNCSLSYSAHCRASE